MAFSRGPLDSETYLDKIKKLLSSIEKEKDSLSKIQIEWESLSKCLTHMDKKMLETQMKQLEHGWEQVEQLVQKKYSQQVVEHDEFGFLMNKIQDFAMSLQRQQQHLQLRMNSLEEQEGNQDVVVLASELQTANHQFSGLKGKAELRMKRIWGEKEKKILENAINDLQEQLEALEPSNTELSSQIQKCEIRNRVKETTLWVENQLREISAPIALLPDDILSQIRRCKVVHDGVLEKQQVVESLAEEIQDNIPHLTVQERDDLNNLQQDLQNQYQILVLKSTQRSQQLELKLEERGKLVAALGRVQHSLQAHEALTIPKMEATSTEADLENQLVALRTSQKELQENESVISVHLQELADFDKDLSVFERLFLDDRLKNLKTRAKRAQRLIQNKCNKVDYKISFYREFHDKMSVLQREINRIEHNELLQKYEMNCDMKDELYRLRDQLTGIQASVLQVLKLKEVFALVGLKWECPQIDRLQSQVFGNKMELEEKIKQLDTSVAEHDKYQVSLGKIRTMDLQNRQRAEVLLETPSSTESNLYEDGLILNQRLEKVISLYQKIIKKVCENKAFEDSFKEKETLQIKQYIRENEELHRVLHSVLLECHAREVDEKNFQDQLENAFSILNQIKSQLEQPLFIDLKIEHVQKEMNNCETFEEQVQAEMCSLRAMAMTKKQSEGNVTAASDIEKKLHDLQDLHRHVNASISLRTVSCYNVIIIILMRLTHLFISFCSLPSICTWAL